MRLERGLHQVRGNQFSGRWLYRAPSDEMAVPGAYGILVDSSVEGAIISENVFSELDGGSIRVAGGASNLVVNGNIHRGSAAALTVDGRPAASDGDLSLGS